MSEELGLRKLPGHLIRRLQQQSVSVFTERTKAAGFDLTSVQFAALDTLEKAPGIDQASLAKRIAYDRATIGSVIKRLEKNGLVSRLPDDKDRRAFQVSLTPQGHSLLEKIRPIVLELQNDILPDLTETERTTLLCLIEKTLKPAG